jgi:hypothetical protein
MFFSTITSGVICLANENVFLTDKTVDKSGTSVQLKVVVR